MADEEPQPQLTSFESLVADFTSESESTVSEAVMTAVAHPDAVQIIEVFQENGLNVNAHNGYLETVLNAAVGTDDELVIYLLSRGADLNFYYLGTSPLSNAAADRDVPAEILSKILANGAKTEQHLALHWAAAAGSFDKSKILLACGMGVKALRGPYDRIALTRDTVLHEAAGAHFAEAKDQRQSPLEWDPDELAQLVKLLLDAEADPWAKDDRGRRLEDWVMNRPGFKVPMCKRLAKSDGPRSARRGI